MVVRALGTDAGLLQSVASEWDERRRFFPGALAIDYLDSNHGRDLYLRTGIQKTLRVSVPLDPAFMDFDQLETFLEVARHASFSRAGEKRFRTQPAISSQIRALEEEVGARLFDRSGGKVSLTASGKLFLKFAEDTLDARKSAMTNIASAWKKPVRRHWRSSVRSW